MERGFVLQWDERKHLLQRWFEDNPTPCSYLTIVQELFKQVLKTDVDGRCYPDEFDTSNITVVDNGDYQGTQIFLIPMKTYQPNSTEYAVTFVSYGSCSGCDTLQAISDSYDASERVPDLMALALHLVQHAKLLYS